MRFLVMALAKGDRSAAPDGGPGAAAAAKMLDYQKSLQKAGVLLAGDELFPPSTGARIACLDGRPTVTDEPFSQSKEAIRSYWVIQVRSREEAIEWAKRAPMSNNKVIEVRQIHDLSDLHEDVRKAAEGFEHLTR
jgi:hypothetical protein